MLVLLWVASGDELEFKVETPIENIYEEQVFDPTEDVSGKDDHSLDITTIFASLVVSLLSVCCATYHLFIKPPNMP